MSSDEVKTPLIDSRDLEQVIDETSALVEGLTAQVGGQGWVRTGPKLDALGALVELVSEISKQTIDSVNAIPGAGFAAYLDLIGARPAAPMPARVPLTFYLVDKSPEDALVPGETQVGATPDPDSGVTDELIFETEEALNVTRASIKAVIVHDPTRDTVDNVSMIAQGLVDASYHAFSGHEPGEHDLYLACDEVFSLEGLTHLEARIELAKPHPLGRFPLQWAYFDGVSWQELDAETQVSGRNHIVTFADSSARIQSTVLGRDGYWLRARLDTTVIPQDWESRDPNRLIRELPNIKRISIHSTSKIEGFKPEVLLHGNGALDDSADFFPFGEVPQLGEVFYLDCGTPLAQPTGSTIALVVELGEAAEDRPPRASQELRLTWEVMQPEGGWTTVGRSSGSQTFAPLKNELNQHQFIDQTLALTKSGRIEFKLPHRVERGKVGQRRGRWLRVRITRGDYGGFEQVTFNSDSQRYEVTPPTLAPPILSRIHIGCEHTIAGAPLNQCISSDLGYTRSHDVGANSQAFSAFRINPAQSKHPSLYLCLDRPFTRSTVSFFVEVLPPEPSKSTPDNYHAKPKQAPELRWDYLATDGWQRLAVRDTTSTFRERGTIRFIGPTDEVRSQEFGISGYWLRVQWTRGGFRHLPRLSKVLLNTVWASHCVTRRNEILGSGLAEENLTLNSGATPVLADTELDVCELLHPSAEEYAEVLNEVPAQRLTVIRDASDRVQQVWVRWEPVTHFHESGPRDRHYTLDATLGRFTFGDGTYGMMVPRGQGNVRLTRYRTGGGVHGNRPSGAVSELKTSVPYVDSVTNHVAASGGTSSESPERVRVRGPMKLRHRDRAVTPGDYEDLALEAAPEVLRAHALTTPFNPIDLVVDLSDLDSEGGAFTNQVGRIVLPDIPEDVDSMSRQASTVHVVIVPNSSANQPAPSLGLLERVESFLRARSGPAVNLQVSGPRWIKVTVTATIVPESDIDPDGLVTEVEQTIQRYLHPLTGGDSGDGWSFGRAPQRSHLFRLLDKLPGVHHVRYLLLETDPPQPEGGDSFTADELEALRGALIYSGMHDISLAPGAYEEDNQ